MIAGDTRPATEYAGATILALNTAATGRDGVRAGRTPRVAARDYGATTNEAPSAYDEASCDATIGAMEWGGAGATVACDAAAAGREAALAGCLTGWQRAMAGRLQTRPGRSIHFRYVGTACSPW